MEFAQQKSSKSYESPLLGFDIQIKIKELFIQISEKDEVI
jgi:hypothetical protein